MKRKLKVIYVFALAFLLSVCALVSLPKTASASQSFEQMITSANSGDTITCVADMSTGAIEITKNLVIDLGGHKLSVNGVITTSGDTNVTIKNGTVEASFTSIENTLTVLQNVIVNGDVFVMQNASAKLNATLNQDFLNNGTAQILGGEYKDEVYNNPDAVLDIFGGNFGADTNYVTITNSGDLYIDESQCAVDVKANNMSLENKKGGSAVIAAGSFLSEESYVKNYGEMQISGGSFYEVNNSNQLDITGGQFVQLTNLSEAGVTGTTPVSNVSGGTFGNGTRTAINSLAHATLNLEGTVDNPVKIESCSGGIFVEQSGNATIKNVQFTSVRDEDMYLCGNVTVEGVHFASATISDGATVELNNCVLQNDGYLQQLTINASNVVINGGSYHNNSTAVMVESGTVQINNAQITSGNGTVENAPQALHIETATGSNTAQVTINEGSFVQSVAVNENATLETFGTIRKICHNYGNVYVKGGTVGNGTDLADCNTAVAIRNYGYLEISGGTISACDLDVFENKTIHNSGANALLVVSGGIIAGTTHCLVATTTSQVKISGGVFAGKLEVVIQSGIVETNHISDMFAPGYFAKRNGVFENLNVSNIMGGFDVVEHIHQTDGATCTTPAKCMICNNYVGSISLFNHASTSKTYNKTGSTVTHEAVYDCCGITTTEAHEAADGGILVQPTYNQAGSKTRTCLVCGETWTVSIPALGGGSGNSGGSGDISDDEMVVLLAELVVLAVFGLIWIAGIVVAVAFIVRDHNRKQQRKTKVDQFMRDYNNRKKNQNKAEIQTAVESQQASGEMAETQTENSNAISDESKQDGENN